MEKVETGIYRRGGTYWVPVFAGRDPLTGKKRYRTATAKTLAEARQLRKKLLAEVEKAGHIPAQPMTFGEFLRHKFLPEHVTNLRPKTQRGYRHIIETHLAPTNKVKASLAHVRLDRLTREHIVKYLAAKKAEGLSERTATCCPAWTSRLPGPWTSFYGTPWCRPGG